MITKLQNQNVFFNLKENTYKKNLMRSHLIGGTKILKEKEFNAKEKIRIVIDGQSHKVRIEELCSREGISIRTFNKWTEEFLNNPSITGESNDIIPFDEYKYKVVIEGKTGATSIAELCRREEIDQGTFFQWCEEFLLVCNRNSILHKLNDPIYKKNKNLINKCASKQLISYCENYIDLSSRDTLIAQNSETILLNNELDKRSILSLQKINDIRYINKYFESINSMLQDGGVFIGCLETFAARRDRMKIRKFPILKNLYFGLEFLFKRIIPKLSLTKKYYFDITKGNNRLLSKAEGLGRLVSCGFSIMDYRAIDGMLYFVVKKVRKPFYDKNPSYGPLYKMPRLGKNGEIIGVYKFRTMHPYSEYLQDYIVKAYGYAESGKPANDFRIPEWGKFMRRIWLDEFPQLLNLLKGELKLVGVRPVSKRYFDDIPAEMQNLRLKMKPGCIPPYVALNKNGNVMSVLSSERQYIEDTLKSPYTTDAKYFLRAIYNIIINSKRSA